MPASNRRDEEARLLYKIARAYYEDGAVQGEIARRFGLSRPKVSRLLQQARDRGVVRITIEPPGVGRPDLEAQLERRYRLDEVVLAPRDRSVPVLDRVGAAAAAYLLRTLQPGDVVGLSWGKALRSLVSQLPRFERADLTVVQLIGGIGSLESGVNGAELTRRLAERCGGRPCILQAPGVVPSRAVKAGLLADPGVAEVLELGRRASVAVVGVGAPLDGSALVGPDGLLTRRELEGLRARRAVADVCLRFLDPGGRPVATDLDDRVVGIDLPALAGVPRRVGVAGGPDKVAAVRAALAGGIVNVLVSDEDTAQALLAA